MRQQLQQQPRLLTLRCARDGTLLHVAADARGAVRVQRLGERAVLDVHIEVDGIVVASLEHEAIIALP